MLISFDSNLQCTKHTVCMAYMQINKNCVNWLNMINSSHLGHGLMTYEALMNDYSHLNI